MLIPAGYSVKGLLQRWRSAMASVLGIALAVFILATTRMLASGVDEAFTAKVSGSEVLVISAGATTEIDSSFAQTKGMVVAGLDAVAKGPGGPLASEEYALLTALERRGKGGPAHVLLRGLGERAEAVRGPFRVVAGRRPAPGAEEAMVGRALRGRFVGADVGQKLLFAPGRELAVVGVFEADGAVAESEIWADLLVVQSLFGRKGALSSVRLRLADDRALDAFKEQVAHDRRLRLRVYRQRELFARQAGDLTGLVVGIGTTLAVLFGLASLVGAMATLHGMVDGRRTEIGLLRVLGFPRRSVIAMVVREAALLAAVGGAVGVGLALLTARARFPLLGPNASEIVIRFRPMPSAFALAFALAFFVAVAGGLIPALRASRIAATEALRAR